MLPEAWAQEPPALVEHRLRCEPRMVRLQCKIDVNGRAWDDFMAGYPSWDVDFSISWWILQVGGKL